VPEGALTEIWTSPPYNHCMFTARPDLDLLSEQRFAEALSGMSYDNPTHRAVLDAEGYVAGSRRTSMGTTPCGR
jgi:ABC-type phosphate/phosphonate transport system substrate-binding protein